MREGKELAELKDDDDGADADAHTDDDDVMLPQLRMNE